MTDGNGGSSADERDLPRGEQVRCPPPRSRRNVVLGIASGVALAGLGRTREVLARPARRSPPGQDLRASRARPPEVTPAEDLMQEHGVLDRVLLVYEAALERLRGKQKLPPGALAHAASLVRRFIEAYHEKTEEDFVFPRLQRAGQQQALVEVLLTQHRRGRTLTHGVLELTRARSLPLTVQEQERLVSLLTSFIRMYRPHAAHEDTVLFPAFRNVVGTDAAYRELGEQFEQREHAVLGARGFRRVVAEVAEIERAFGIADLAAFTPAQVR